MSNLSQAKRKEMLDYISKLKEIHNDDESIIALKEIENALTEKKYGLVWEQHSEKVDEMLKDNIPVFTEEEEKKIVANEEKEFNFLLEGDNLHSLKLLEKTHKGLIDVIYIDPPYNRGKNDFRYNDDYIVKEDGYRHSKWLSFMSERLIIAKELLNDKGLIFISIDDNEVAQLRLLMDEIFGESNFINSFIWKRNSSVKTEKDKFTINTEYVLLYAKTLKFELNPAYKPLSEATKKMYNKNDNDGRGNYRLYPLQKPKDPGPETTYDYVDNNGKIWKCPKNGWRMKYEKLKALEDDGRLCLDNKSLNEKAYWNERENEGKRIDTLWNDLPENTTGSSELELALGEKGKFSNPKPIKLVQRCLEISNNNAVVLDYFAGSGTTGHAVMQLNKEDGGNRKYILCTNNENNICEEVTYQRLKNIQEDLPHNLKYYKTDFIPKLQDDEDVLSDRLLDHIKEMVELENACEIDGVNRNIMLTQEELEEYASKEIKENTTIYIPHYLLLSRELEERIKKKNVRIVDIPDYYFIDELREGGER
ncbi:TPA: site-specific DNA-methyltransferase [Clostridioides difficile]|uniref:site-specific DNA-methyltransferase n=1 Tax=Clostridia TaxID=186801 RepID=UPI0005A627AB|nr:site-specific DNA-methyltransferase [Clostridioides difficile]MDU4953675.1 site-specific DNA-methyltransferase [Clostridium sp.]EGT5008213.1 site-specific DNA-methyltransferase [Clostridioides difficile]MCJ0177836.1 site-specific DNA-methyltransferase [Clostridioides difficile]NIZ86266.1 site-specific DNA-methyltransferase [Clostridioides difficile]HBF6354650.1 site-specific DNA-methyltransferase [Clostridioides difficile]